MSYIKIQFSINAEAYLEPSGTSTMELFCENSFLEKSYIVDVRLGSKYTSGSGADYWKAWKSSGPLT